jgi:uncharacterized membrane protein YhhN
VRTSTRRKLAYLGLAALDTGLSASASPLAHRARFVTKPLLMPVLASSVLSSRRTSLTAPVVIAEACGFVGDVALLSEARRPFFIGSAAFALGHASYVAGFMSQRSASPVFASRRTRALGALWAVAAPVNAVRAGRRDPAQGAAVAAYSLSLTSMAIASGHLSPSVRPSARALAGLGGLAFLTSDSLLGLRKFVLSDPPPALEGAVMATYTGAQFLLAEAATRA